MHMALFHTKRWRDVLPGAKSSKHQYDKPALPEFKGHKPPKPPVSAQTVAAREKRKAMFLEIYHRFVRKEERAYRIEINSLVKEFGVSQAHLTENFRKLGILNHAPHIWFFPEGTLDKINRIV